MSFTSSFKSARSLLSRGDSSDSFKTGRSLLSRGNSSFKTARSDSFKSADSFMTGRSLSRTDSFKTGRSLKSLLSSRGSSRTTGRNVYTRKSSYVTLPRATLVSETTRIREVFEYALRIARVALEKAEWIVAASKTKAPISANIVARTQRHADSIKHFIQDITSQQREWMRVMKSSKTTVTVPNWPLTPMQKHGDLKGMRFKSAFDHAAPNVAMYMNEVGHYIEKSMDEIKRHKVSRSTYDFDQARTKQELNQRLWATKQVMHPSLHPYVMTSYHKALKHL
jgi:hypothetical protein